VAIAIENANTKNKNAITGIEVINENIFFISKKISGKSDITPLQLCGISPQGEN
jgi:hypothetical protein